MSGPRVEADGTGIEWRIVGGVVQHRYAAECFPNRVPGPWTPTPDVDRITHPARVAALSALRAFDATGDAVASRGGSDG